MSRPARPLSAWAAAAVAVLAVWQQAQLGLDGDVSWLLTVAERVADGAVPYRDVAEVNPPASILLYLPGVLIARTTGLRAEAVTVAGTLLLALWAWRAIVRVTGGGARTAAVLLLVPAACFAQREHAAVLALLPALAALIAGGRPGRAALLAAGLGAGVAVAIKPHFAAALLLPLVWAWARGERGTAAIGAAAAGVALVYAGAVLWWFPAYLATVPDLASGYLPSRTDWISLLRGPAVAPFAALAALCWATGGRRFERPAAVLLLAGAGFVLAALVQGKGYLNHGLPQAVLGLLALGSVGGAPARIGWAAMAAIEWYAFANVAERPALARAVARYAPPRPRLIALSIELTVGHPLVRRMDGRWAGRSAALYLSGGGIEAREAAGFAEDVRRRRPDAVLVDDTLPGYADRHPGVAAALRPYRPVARADGVSVWVRRLAPVGRPR